MRMCLSKRVGNCDSQFKSLLEKFLPTMAKPIATEVLLTLGLCRDSPELRHASVQTTERYLGCKQKLRQAVNDKLALEDT
jgi:hypothetical protein